MSLEKYKKEELATIAEFYGSDLPEKFNKPDAIAILVEDGVTEEMADELMNPDKEEETQSSAAEDQNEEESVPENSVEEEPEEEKVLVKYTRRGGSYRVHGHTFNPEQPFKLVSEDTAEYVLQVAPNKFKLATPREAREFYE